MLNRWEACTRYGIKTKSNSSSCHRDCPTTASARLTITIVLADDFSKIIGRRKEDFLRACTIAVSAGGKLDVESTDVRAGSIILELQGSPDALAAAKNDIAANGLKVEGFPPLTAVGGVGTTGASTTACSRRGCSESTRPAVTRPAPTTEK